jgi:hypothetical protein
MWPHGSEKRTSAATPRSAQSSRAILRPRHRHGHAGGAEPRRDRFEPVAIRRFPARVREAAARGAMHRDAPGARVQAEAQRRAGAAARRRGGREADEVRRERAPGREVGAREAEVAEAAQRHVRSSFEEPGYESAVARDKRQIRKVAVQE